jgi:hypothetical protein
MKKKSALHPVLFGAIFCTLFACGKIDVGPKKTTTNALTWTQASALASLNVYQLAVSGSTVFAATSGGLYSSTDAGSSWTKAGGGLPANASASTVAVNGSNIYAGTTAGIYYSTNTGTTWTAVASSDVALPTALAVIGNNFFGASLTGGVFLSTDNGTTWTPVNAGLPSNGSVVSLMVSGSNLFAGVIVENGVGGAPGSTIYLSTNNGTSWSALSTGLPQVADLNSLTIDGNTLYAGITGYTNADVAGGSGIYTSTNNGSSWTTVGGSGLPPSPFNAISMASSGSNIFAGYDSDGVYLSTNNGSTWTALGDDQTDDLTVGCIAIVGTTVIIGDSLGGRGVFTATF